MKLSSTSPYGLYIALVATETTRFFVIVPVISEKYCSHNCSLGEIYSISLERVVWYPTTLAYLLAKYAETNQFEDMQLYGIYS